MVLALTHPGTARACLRAVVTNGKWLLLSSEADRLAAGGSSGGGGGGGAGGLFASALRRAAASKQHEALVGTVRGAEAAAVSACRFLAGAAAWADTAFLTAARERAASAFAAGRTFGGLRASDLPEGGRPMPLEARARLCEAAMVPQDYL
jgi:hypothetical protein